jgi:hypothetical protein
MLTRFMVLLVAGTALAGCCASGTGEERRPAKRKVARNREIILGPLNGSAPQSDAKAQYDNWEKRPNEDAEADARLARQTKICRGC